MTASITLPSGVQMPMVGLGTWKSKPGDVEKSVKAALDIGYRHIDCAALYQNEKEVGAALEARLGSTLKREDVFITSKLWNTMHAAEDVKPACQQTLKDLGLEYLDLYLMHWPIGFQKTGATFPSNPDGTILFTDVPFMETWAAMEKLVDEGLCKQIGLSNFNSKQVTEVLNNGRIKPVVLQVECHPYFNQSKLLNFCKEKGIVMTAYSPLGSPDRPWAKSNDVVVLNDPVLKKIGDRYNKSPAQVALRFNVQRGVIVIPKSVTPSRIQQNQELFDFKLSESEMKTVEGLDRGPHGRVLNPMLEINGKVIPRDGQHQYYPFHEEF
ncbi:aldo-keto reductase family 1 member A1-A-like [Glandiceps talaboti]